MLILDYIKELKKAVKEFDSFNDLLNKAKNIEFKNRTNILEHFDSVIVKSFGNFIQLKYDTKKMFKLAWDEFYISSRGILIDWINENVILYPFDKFFELDENKNVNINVVQKRYKEGKIIELTDKIDGSLIISRYYNNQFIITSSSSINSIHADIAKEILFKDPELVRFVKDFSDYTVIFELCNTEYSQLVKYNENKLTVIGMRNMNDNRLLYNFEIAELAKEYNINVVSINNYSLEDILKNLEEPDLTDMEGYVLRIDNFMVKIKSKNYIMANRFMGDPARNFNMVIDGFNENRLVAIRKLIRPEFLQSFDITINMLNNYYKEKEKMLTEMFSSISPDLSKDCFVWKAREKFPKYADVLIQMKIGKYEKIDKYDKKYLKDFSEYLVCVSHYKYAELLNIPLDELEKDIINGKIKYIKKFEDSNDKIKVVYIIPKWQFLDFNKIHYRK